MSLISIPSLKDLLAGSWSVKSIHTYQPGKGPITFIPSSPDGFIWEFSQERISDFTPERRACFGKLTEHFIDGEAAVSGYAYFPAAGKLLIGDYGYEPDEFMAMHITERYRMEKISASECRLYAPEDVGHDPEDNLLRFKLERRQEGAGKI